SAASQICAQALPTPPPPPPAVKSCSTSEPASPTNEPRSLATTSSAAACTTSPPASTPSSTPSTTTRNSNCYVYSSKMSGSPAGTSRSGSGSPSNRHHPTGHTRPAQQANHHPPRARCQCLLKKVCVPLVAITSAWWTRRSIMAAATTSSPNTSPHRPNGLLEVTIRLARSYRDETSWKNRLAASASNGM